MSLASAVLSQYTRTTDRRHVMTLAKHCNANRNVWLKTGHRDSACYKEHEKSVILASLMGCVVFCSNEFPTGRQWWNGLELFHGLEICHPLELLLRSGCLTEVEPELVVAALKSCPEFADNGLFRFLQNKYYMTLLPFDVIG